MSLCNPVWKYKWCSLAIQKTLQLTEEWASVSRLNIFNCWHIATPWYIRSWWKPPSLRKQWHTLKPLHQFPYIHDADAYVTYAAYLFQAFCPHSDCFSSAAPPPTPTPVMSSVSSMYRRTGWEFNWEPAKLIWCFYVLWLLIQINCSGQRQTTEV